MSSSFHQICERILKWENILSEKGVLSHDFYVLMGKKEAESAFCLICFWIFWRE